MNYFKKIIQKPELIFVIIASFFGLISSVFLPVLAVPDENQHFQISYAMFSANKQAPEDLVFNESMILATVQNHQYKELFFNRTSAANDGVAINTGSLVFDKKTKASVFDIMHLPQAIGVLIGKLLYPSVGVMVLMGRLTTLALYIVALYFIIKKVRHGKRVLAFVASLPIMVQQAASVSYDPINTLAIFAWFAFIINIATQNSYITKKQVAIGILLAAFLFISKSNNALLLLLALAVPLKYLFPYLRTLKQKPYWNTLKYILIGLVILVATAALYYMSKKLLAGQELHPRRLWDALVNTFIWGNEGLIDVTTIGIVGQFSNFYYHLPIWVVIVTFVIFTILLLHEKLPEVSKRFALISGLLFFGSILLISIGMYYGWAMKPERFGPGASVTDGIQGRYFTPLLILLFPLFAYLQKHIKIASNKKQLIPMISIGTSTLLLVFYTAQTWHFFWK